MFKAGKPSSKNNLIKTWANPEQSTSPSFLQTFAVILQTSPLELEKIRSNLNTSFTYLTKEW